MPNASAPPVLRFGDGGSTEAVGGHVALDLVNTVSWRLDPPRTVDRLPDAAALVRWGRWIGLLDDERTEAFTRELVADDALGRKVSTRVRRLREQLYAVVHPVVTGSEPAAEDLAGLRRLLVAALGRAGVSSVFPLEWATGLRSARDLPDELALHAWRLLEHEDAERIRQCHGTGCGWLFLDRTRNASRVWCSSADCGNRIRVRRHYQRRARAGAASPEAGLR